jgi:copper homeostasis protein CutC
MGYTLDGEIDVKATARFRREAADGIELTFPRAIDIAQDPVWRFRCVIFDVF